jgi:isopenicillin N synthase-like dioxygenase
VPVIDMAAYGKASASEPPPESLVREVAVACEQWGFFQIVNHDLDTELRARAEEQQRAFFALPVEVKERMRRTADNSRGWYDDELTKQRRDWKEGLDFGSTPRWPAWAEADNDAADGMLDGFNRFPPTALLPEFRPTMLAYYDGLCEVAARLTRLFSLGLGMPADYFEPALARHTSYLRLNYYAPYTGSDPSQLCISPHKDAGFLTVLAQDEHCHSLQVRDRSQPDQWSTVRPEPGSLTINTGDMAQIYSNNRYHAPEHRVLTSPSKARYSAPFFYNPDYAAAVAPLPSLGDAQFDELNWGYFRAQRFAGDFADYGTEIQIADFAKGSGSWHVENQSRFLAATDFRQPFSVEANRPLLSNPTAR